MSVLDCLNAAKCELLPKKMVNLNDKRNNDGIVHVRKLFETTLSTTEVPTNLRATDSNSMIAETGVVVEVDDYDLDISCMSGDKDT
jgi:hypothetical protein